MPKAPCQPDRSQYPSKRPDGSLDIDLASGKYLELWQGPQHPGITGNMSVELTVCGDEVVEGKTHVGYLHRGFEKLMERRTFGSTLADVRDVMLKNAVFKKRAVGLALTGLETAHCLSVFDEQGRFAPKCDDGNVEIHGAGLVVEAIGKAADLACLGEPLTEALEWNRNRIRIDADGRTSEPWLWAAGDAVEGPNVIHAVAAGHRVAPSMMAGFAHQSVDATGG